MLRETQATVDSTRQPRVDVADIIRGIACIVSLLASISRYCCQRMTRRESSALIQYMTRCPFSLSRLVKVTDTGQAIYKAEKS